MDPYSVRCDRCHSDQRPQCPLALLQQKMSAICCAGDDVDDDDVHDLVDAVVK